MSIEEREFNFCEISFFLRKDETSKNLVKYGSLANVKFARKVINSAIVACHQYQRTVNEDVSFLFFGFPKYTTALTKKGKLKSEAYLKETQRFRLYIYLINKSFSDDKWAVITLVDVSACLILNRLATCNEKYLQVFKDYFSEITEEFKPIGLN